MQDDLYTFITLENYMSKNIIHDVIIHPYKVNRDPRGTLTEALKTTWEDVYDTDHMPFAQMYFSSTDPGVARDEGKWHYHPGGQQDRFGVIRGDIVVAIMDNREGSTTKGLLNLFHMGEAAGDDGQFMLLVPKQTLHGYVVVGDSRATMYNFPTRLYDPSEEHRVPMEETPLADGSVFSYQKALEAYKHHV
jgi:dTDP-4-dehydrorhamnose 3,5-epimerase